MFWHKKAKRFLRCSTVAIIVSGFILSACDELATTTVSAPDFLHRDNQTRNEKITAADTANTTNSNHSTLAADTAEIFSLVNALRERHKAPTLTPDAKLAEIATAYAQELARRGELSHFDRAGNSLENRLNQAGFSEWREAGENLARRTFAGYLPSDIVKSWNLSRAHYEAMIDRAYHRTGIGGAVDERREFIYYVQLFAD